MKNNVVKSKKDMGEKHDFIEYQHAKKVTEDFPALILILNKLIPVLYEKSYYTGVFTLLQSAQDTKLLLEMQYDYYYRVYKNKGKIDERK